ncbi:craniofacial development protein 2-like, partial [Aphis craccivora]
LNDTHQFGTGFAVHKSLLSAIKEFNPISERVCTIKLNTKPMNIFIINIHAPTENKDETDKDEFFEEVTTIYDEAPGNTIKIIVGDCNAKLGKEPAFRPTIGMHSAHEIIGKELSCRRQNEVTDVWNMVQEAVKIAAKNTIGESKNQTKPWYNNTCKNAVRKRNEARLKYLRFQTQERRKCKGIIQKEKRTYMNDLLRSTEQDYSHGKIRQFFKKIKRYKTFNPSLKAIRDKDNKTILMDPNLTRWREYFEELLNSELPELSIPEWAGHTVDARVEDLCIEETNRAINSLKDWKSPGSDGIPAELIKYGGEEIHKIIHEICSEVWKTEVLPNDWKKAIIIPLYKKANKCIGEYQSGFRKVFVDFRKAYDSIHRDSLYNILQEFGFPRKLIALTRICMNDTKYQVRVDQTLSEEFEVITGLKQGDALSPLLFNIALEKIIRRFADNLNLIGDSMEIVEQNINTLVEGAKTVGLKINQDKTKVMELLPNGEENVVINDYTFE